MRWLLLILIMFSSYASASSQWCSGTISRTYIAKDGTLFIFGSWRNDYTAICNVNEIRDGVTVDVCKSWLSMVITGKTAQIPMIAYYSNVPSCTEIPKYNAAPSPGYIMLSN
jgi:hypothetical protein